MTIKTKSGKKMVVQSGKKVWPKKLPNRKKLA